MSNKDVSEDSSGVLLRSGEKGSNIDPTPDRESDEKTLSQFLKEAENEEKL